MLTKRDMDAGIAAAHKALPKAYTGIGDNDIERVVAAVILAVDAERSPVAITKDVLGSIFAPRLHRD